MSDAAALRDKAFEERANFLVNLTMELKHRLTAEEEATGTSVAAAMGMSDAKLTRRMDGEGKKPTLKFLFRLALALGYTINFRINPVIE